jgi:peptide/nickel transport system substrate-binding protein
MFSRTKVALLLLAALLLVAGTVSAQDPVTFTFGEFGNPVNLDSAIVTDGISFRVTRQGCESLLEFSADTTSVTSSLATSWEVSEDGLMWTLQLVEGATFQDGTPFNAEAVVWNFDRWRLTDHPQHYPEQTFEYYGAQFNGFDDESLITNVEATGESTVVFTLASPIGAFLNNLAMPMFALHSPAAIEAAGLDYGTPGVGYTCTGPFRFVSWTSDDEVVLERYADYWGEFPGNVERVIIDIIPDTAARLAALLDGAIDAFEQPAVEDLQTIADGEDTYIQYRPSFNTFYLAFNYRIAEFRNPLVRRAMSLAIDRASIVEAFYNPDAIPANTFHPPTITVGFNDEITTPYDPDQARALLAEAGFPDGFSEVNVLGVDDAGNITEEVVETIPVRVYFMPVVRPYNPDGEAIGEATVAMLADIGIQAELASAGDWSAYLAARANGELVGLYQLGWTGDNGDPDNFMGYFFAAADTPLAREGFYQNVEVASLLQQARTLTDAAEREPLYDQAEALVAEGAERIFVAHGPVPLAFRSRVSGYITNPLGNELFKYVTIGE